MEECSDGGVQRWLACDQGTEAPPQPGHAALYACALCLLAAERFAPLIPAAWAPLILLGGTPPRQALPWRFTALSTL